MAHKTELPAGYRFARLTVIRQAPNNYAGSRQVEAKCDCGKTKVVRASLLAAGKVFSCGCFHRERVPDYGDLGDTPAHRSWQSMMRRCSAPSDPFWNDYGVRGIKVCERWHDFMKFYEDMGQRPEGHTLDRVDPNGDYCPENCRWATAKEQCRNRRNNWNVSYQGRTQCISAWAAELGVDKTTLRHRLLRGWSAEEALSRPIAKRRPGPRRAG